MGEKCSGEVSQHYITMCYCIGLRKVSIRGLNQVQMVSIWTGIYGKTVLPDFEESNQMVTWPMTSRDPETTKSWPQYAPNMHTISKTAEDAI